MTVMRTIFRDCIMDEIDNVIHDADGNLKHRGHVVAIALLCALDAISSYGYGPQNGRQIPQFVFNHFPDAYKPHGHKLLNLYRHAMVHSWNLFGASVLTGNETLQVDKGILSFGLLHLKDALWYAVGDYLAELPKSQRLLKQTLKRYRSLVRTAKS